MKVETPGIQIRESFLLSISSACSLLAEEDGNIISVTLPPSQHSWTVIVTRGIISNNVCVAENKPTGPSTTIYSSPLSTRANMSSSNDTAEPGFDLPIKSSGAEGSAFHAATKIIEGDSASGFGNMLTTNLRRPSLDVATIDAGMGMLSLEGRVSAPIPPSRVDPPSHLRDCPSCEQFRVSKDVQTRYPPWLIGWKTGLSWIVVIRGRDVGVFHEFW
jgi:hypothetical protein